MVKNIPGCEDEQAGGLCATLGGVRVIGAYFPTGQAPGSDKCAYKMRWLGALREWVRVELAAHPRLVLMGDYNITFDDDDVWDPVGLKDTIHCTEEERYHLRALISLGLHDAYRLLPQAEASLWKRAFLNDQPVDQNGRIGHDQWQKRRPDRLLCDLGSKQDLPSLFFPPHNLRASAVVHV